ncbi:MAG: CDP-alcohol phosphatidyltransferase family protein [Pseudomonadota bacterium]
MDPLHGNKSKHLRLVISSWPNLVSLMRLLSVPLLVWLILMNYMQAAFITATIAGLSDIVDGFMARALKASTTVGAYLDPLADKVLLIGLYLTLGYKTMIPVWLVILIVFRDLFILGGVLLLTVLGKTFPVRPIMSSKLNTFLQIVFVAWILGDAAFGITIPWINLTMLYSVALTTIYSGGAYVFIGLNHLAEPSNSQPSTS